MPRRVYMGIWERLERRRLFATGGDSNWTSILDADGAFLVINNDSGQHVQLPKPSADGSVSLMGSDDAETITVENVRSLPAAASNDLTQRVYFSTSKGVFGLNLPYVIDSTLFDGLVTGEQNTLAEARTRQADAIARNASASELTNAANDVQRAQDGVDRLAAIETVKDATNHYLRYRMDGVYEVYVAMAGEVNESAARIRIDAAGGNDIVAIGMSVPLKASLSGGWGADKLTSGKRRSILYGGGGADRLFSRSLGGATLDGGKGADRYYNRFGEVNILGRDDGDMLMLNGSPVIVTQSGVFGIWPTSGDLATSNSNSRYYFFADGDESQTNLLA